MSASTVSGDTCVTSLRARHFRVTGPTPYDVDATQVLDSATDCGSSPITSPGCRKAPDLSHDCVTKRAVRETWTDGAGRPASGPSERVTTPDRIALGN